MRDRTRNPLVYRMTLHPTEPPGQGKCQSLRRVPHSNILKCNPYLMACCLCQNPRPIKSLWLGRRRPCGKVLSAPLDGEIPEDKAPSVHFVTFSQHERKSEPSRHLIRVLGWLSKGHRDIQGNSANVPKTVDVPATGVSRQSEQVPEPIHSSSGTTYGGYCVWIPIRSDLIKTFATVYYKVFLMK